MKKSLLILVACIGLSACTPGESFIGGTLLGAIMVDSLNNNDHSRYDRPIIVHRPVRQRPVYIYQYSPRDRYYNYRYNCDHRYYRCY
jgi:hypothetical protein